MSRSREPISPQRKGAYYLGGLIMLIGFLTFGSVFVTAIGSFGEFDNFESDAKSSMTRAVLGMALLIVGGIVRGVGARGLAGSGVVLDPDKARDDLSPYSRMAGGMVRDALDEGEIQLGGRSERVVVIKCLKCSHLNEEDSKFCQECGAAI